MTETLGRTKPEKMWYYISYDGGKTWKLASMVKQKFSKKYENV